VHGSTRAHDTRRLFTHQNEVDCDIVRHSPKVVLIAVEDPTGQPFSLLRLRAYPGVREALLSIGRPFFAPRADRDRIGVVVTDDTDCGEIRELVTESYRVLAPKKLTVLLD
jgi:hypothetical protein